MYSVAIILVLRDNYSYLLIDEATKQDPVEPEKVIAKAKEVGVEITTVLTTHNHWDHAGGNSKIARLLPHVRIFGGRGDAAEAVTDEVGQGDVIEVGQLKVQTIFTPCHTPGHVSYYISGSPGAVFTGDTLFVGGNFNTGTPAEMHENLLVKLGQLPKDTLVYVGHEYTLRNLQFALHVEPGNKKLQEKLKWTQNTRNQGKPTVPSTIEDEWATNPFMRVNEETIKKFTGKQDPVDCLFAVRTMKDEWGKTH